MALQGASRASKTSATATGRLMNGEQHGGCPQFAAHLRLLLAAVASAPPSPTALTHGAQARRHVDIGELAYGEDRGSPRLVVLQNAKVFQHPSRPICGASCRHPWPQQPPSTAASVAAQTARVTAQAPAGRPCNLQLTSTRFHWSWESLPRWGTLARPAALTLRRQRKTLSSPQS